MKKKKIVFVIGSMNRGGAEKVISLISNYLCENNWDVYIAMLIYNEVGYKLNKEVKLIDLTFKDKSYFKNFLKWIKLLRKTVINIKPDIVLPFAARIGLLTQISCLGLNTNIVISERNDPYMDGRSKIIDLLTWYFYPKAKALIFQTKRALGYFKKYKLQNIHIIPNPVEISCFAHNSKQENKIVTVGRLTEQKNQKMLINSFKSIHVKFPNAKLYIYGDGNLKDELLNQINFLQLKDSVFLKGNIENIHQEISDAELFVLSSNYEGLSNALLEAMAMGLPCISTKCAGSDEYIQDGVNGLLTDVDNETELTEAIENMLSNKKAAKSMGIEAKKIINQLDKNKLLVKWHEVIFNSAINS